jgi:hypothetical protein
MSCDPKPPYSVTPTTNFSLVSIYTKEDVGAGGPDV